MSLITADPLIKTSVALASAFVLGGLIGLERQIRQRTAGLRTNVLVSVGAAAFVDLGARVAGPDGSVRVISYVVSGIGFLGAGVIMKEGAQVRGLNTAATLWASAAVGAFAGSGYAGEAALVTLFILAGNTLLRPLVEFVNRRPLASRETEALYQVHVVCRPENAATVREVLVDEMESHRYPVRAVHTVGDNDEVVEFAAELMPSSGDEAELDRAIAHLKERAEVLSATWSVSAIA
jgi:putative Mg2+ transporter-C (MgtC) family protein